VANLPNQEGRTLAGGSVAATLNGNAFLSNLNGNTYYIQPNSDSFDVSKIMAPPIGSASETDSPALDSRGYVHSTHGSTNYASDPALDIIDNPFAEYFVDTEGTIPHYNWGVLAPLNLLSGTDAGSYLLAGNSESTIDPIDSSRSSLQLLKLTEDEQGTLKYLPQWIIQPFGPFNMHGTLAGQPAIYMQGDGSHLSNGTVILSLIVAGPSAGNYIQLYFVDLATGVIIEKSTLIESNPLLYGSPMIVKSQTWPSSPVPGQVTDLLVMPTENKLYTWRLPGRQFVGVNDCLDGVFTSGLAWGKYLPNRGRVYLHKKVGNNALLAVYQWSYDSWSLVDTKDIDGLGITAYWAPLTDVQGNVFTHNTQTLRYWTWPDDFSTGHQSIPTSTPMFGSPCMTCDGNIYVTGMRLNDPEAQNRLYMFKKVSWP
jgi:hypothetical protein